MSFVARVRAYAGEAAALIECATAAVTERERRTEGGSWASRFGTSRGRRRALWALDLVTPILLALGIFGLRTRPNPRPDPDEDRTRDGLRLTRCPALGVRTFSFVNPENGKRVRRRVPSGSVVTLNVDLR